MYQVVRVSVAIQMDLRHPKIIFKSVVLAQNVGQKRDFVLKI